MACFILAAASPAQQAPPIRVNVDLAQVEAVVTDSKGRHVPGLHAEDFQLFIDGKERPITYFSYIDSGPTSSTEAVRREDVHRTIVLMIDEVHTSPENLSQLVPIFNKFVEQQVRPGDLVSVMATRNNMGIYEQFTSDPKRMRAALDRIVRLAGMNYDQINPPRPGEDRAGLVNAANAYFMETYHALSMEALGRAIEGLRDMPGRKAIVLFSDGIEFPTAQLSSAIGEHADPDYVFRMRDRTAKTVDQANRAGVVLYTFDTKFVFSAGLDPNRRASMQKVHYVLAQETGGIFVHDTNMLSEALGKAMEDMTGYYLLGFKPDAAEFNRKRSPDDNHRIRVKLRPSGLTVRTRTGTNLAGGDRTAPPPRDRAETMRRALFSPFAGGGIQVRMTPVYSAAKPHPKTGKREPMLRALLSIDTRDLQFNAEGGKRTAVIDVASAAMDADGKAVKSSDQRFTLDFPAAQAARPADRWITYQIDIPVPKPGAYEIRAAVHDDGAGTIGSAASFVEVPDFNKGQLVLSSLVLSESEAKGAQRDATTASRSFTIGRKIYYGFQVYGAKAVKPAGTNVDMELHLFRDGSRVFASRPIPLAPDPDSDELTVVGSFLVPEGFAEGDYTVQLVAHDRLAGSKRNVASQQVEVTLTK